ncbi:MAG: RidA family protein [Pseudomonadota bacterium]
MFRARFAALLLAAGLTACSAPEPAPAPPETEQADAITVARDALGPFAPTRSATKTLHFSLITAPAGSDGLIAGGVEDQTGAALTLLGEALEDQQLGLSDITRLRIYVVTEGGEVDEAGLSRALTRAFATPLQPGAPARTVVGVSALPGGARVGLEADAWRHSPSPAPNPDET